MLKIQTYQDFEIVQVDDNSSDGTESLIYDYFKSHRIKFIKVPLGSFSHPFSSNLGAENSSGKYLVYLNGHSIPITKNWLSDGLSNFVNDKVAGVFGWNLPNQEANWLEKFFYNFYTKILHNKKEIFRKTRLGVLGTSSAILKKDLWIQYHFNMDFEAGGEDTDWARHWIKKGYVIIQDPKFRTYHSHNLYLIGLIKQYLKWHKMLKPSRTI